MKKIIVTGATSMLGVALIKKCIENKVQVTALVRRNSSKIKRLPNSPLISILECDLDELSNIFFDVCDYDTFYHLGWTNTQKQDRMNAQLQSINIKYTLDAIDLAKRAGCSKFIGAGSQAEYGIHTTKETSPDSPVNPQTAYGIAKYAAGKLGELKAKSLDIKDFFWVRIFSVYGFYDTPNSIISMTIAKLKNGEHCSFTNAEHQWDFLFSEDAGTALCLIGKKSKGYKVYCLGAGHSAPLKWYLEVVRNTVSPNSILGIGEIPSNANNTQGMCANTQSLVNDIGEYAITTFEQGIKELAL